MELTYVLVVAFVAYIFGAITKIFITKIPCRFIPIQNVLIGIISGVICYYGKIEPNFLQSIAMCLMATMGAGGISDLVQLKNKEKKDNPTQEISNTETKTSV